MEKNKKKSSLTLWHQWRQSPQFFKNLFVAVSFLILLIISVLLVWKVYKNGGEAKSKVALPPASSSAQVAQKPVIKNVLSPQNPQPEVKFSQTLQRLLMRNVIEGEVSSQTLKMLLQKTPEPWAQNLLTQLAPIVDDIKNYSQLEELLALSIPPERPSFLERIKTIIRPPSPLSRMKEKREYKTGWLGAIQKALHSHNIQNALYYFEKLSPQEQSQLTSWNDYARRLLAFETIMKTNPISESPEVQAQKTLQIEHKLIAYALLNGIMEELFPPQALMTFLQKNPEPWAQNLLTKVAPIIHDTGSYLKLQEILVVFGPLRSAKKPIHIRKMDERGEYKNVEIEDLQKALQEHDLQKAINYYEDLPSQEKNLLKDWSDYAKRLQILDTETKRLYLKIMEGLN